jgi:hypothetical protein
MTGIYKIEKSNSLKTTEYLIQLEEIRTEIEKALAQGKISESQYGILNTKYWSI